MQRLITFLLFVLFAVPAESFVLRGSGGGGTPPGTLLVGDNTQYSGTTLYTSSLTSSAASSTGITAVSTGNLATGYVYISSWWDCGATEYISMAVYNQSDSSLVAESAVLECGTVSTGWVQFTFSTGSITSGNAYHLTVIPGATIGVPGENLGVSCIRQGGQTPGSAPDPVVTGTYYSTGRYGGMYVTN